MSALRQSPTLPTLSPDEIHFLRATPSDTEDAPWMVMNDRQWRDATALFWSLENYGQTHRDRVAWYPGGMLPLTYRPPGARRRKQVAPDVFAALTPVEGHDSWSIEREGMPPFVLEVVSRSSVKRDLEAKRELYRLLGAREYAIVRLDLAEPRLEGYRRSAAGGWGAWAPDEEGRLWSEVIELGLVLRGGEVRAVTRAGEVLRTPAEETLVRQQEALARQQEALARRQEALARERAEAARETAEAAQRRAEEEATRLRAALERLTRGDDETPSG